MIGRELQTLAAAIIDALHVDGIRIEVRVRRDNDPRLTPERHRLRSRVQRVVGIVAYPQSRLRDRQASHVKLNTGKAVIFVGSPSNDAESLVPMSEIDRDIASIPAARRGSEEGIGRNGGEKCVNHADAKSPSAVNSLSPVIIKDMMP